MSAGAAPDPALVAACERVEAAAFTDIAAAAPPGLTTTFGLVHARVGGAFAIASRALEKRMYNHVFGLGVHAPVSAADLDALEAFFARAGSGSVRIALSPGPNAAALAASLRERRFAPEDRWLRLWRDAAAPLPEGASRTAFTIRDVAPSDALAFGRLLTSTFAHPEASAAWFSRLVGRNGWRVIGAHDGGTLVGCGALYVEDGAGWLGLGATLASHRRRGAQGAVIAARIEAARAAGAGLLAIETLDDTPAKPNPSTHNARRLGFLDLHPRDNWVKVLREVPPATR